MSGSPLLSVVMSVYNDAQRITTTLASMLSQKGASFEFIVIDDGSTDETGRILDAHARQDSRLHVVHQENTGLTRALIRGCALARGKYIARQDGGGDVSLPDRLNLQAKLLESQPEVVMTSCGTRFMGPEGEKLYEVAQSGDELQHGLQGLTVSSILGPSHHGSTAFRKSAYLKVGGYRVQFGTGQDLDLWTRLAEIGQCSAIPQVLYHAQLTPGSISATKRIDQIKATRVIINCANQRRLGLDDEVILDKHQRSSHHRLSWWRDLTGLNEAQFHYFIGCMLRKRDPSKAKVYYKRSLRSFLFYPPAMIRLALINTIDDEAP